MSASTGKGTITNDDTETLTISSPTMTEGTAAGTTTFTFTVTLPKAVVGCFTVAFTDIVALSLHDALPISTISPLVFTGVAGETQTISVDITRDAIVEDNEQFTIKIGRASGREGVQAAAVTSGATGTGTITNDYSETLTISSPTVTEGTAAGTTTLTFTVTSPKAVEGGVTVIRSDRVTSAQACDFPVSTISPLVFTGVAGETQTISVDITRDAIVEDNEQFTI